jgi:hypothetical protein
MEYSEFVNKIGVKYDIVSGVLTQSETGPFTVTETLNSCCIYLNKSAKTVQLIVPDSMYIGKKYALRHSDCVQITMRWSDENQGTKLLEVYKTTPHKIFYEYYMRGISDWFIDNNCILQTVPNIGDFIVYEYQPGAKSHIGICVAPGKMLHHMPNKLSSIDTIDTSKIIGIYRYAN